MTLNRLSVVHDYGWDGDYETAAASRERQREQPNADDKAVQRRLREEMYARRAAAELAQVADDIDVISRAAMTPRDAA